jgi:anti-sigma-K factor RskA
MDDDQVADLLSFYALGALSDDESAQVEAYLARHPEAQRTLAEMRLAVDALPLAAEPMQPSPRPRQRLLERIAAENRPAAADEPSSPLPVQRTFWQKLWLIFPRYALTGLSLVVILWLGLSQASLNSEITRLRAEIARLAVQVQEQQGGLAQANLRLEELAAASLQAIPLQGTASQPLAHGQLIADPASGSALLVVSNLARLPESQTYQVWLIDQDTPSSAGLFELGESGQAVLLLSAQQNIGDYDALGISVEPDGGSPLPTGDIVVLSQLN